MTPEEQYEHSYRDPITHNYNERAFRDMKPPADRPMVGIIAVEGTKKIKDKLGWSARDQLLQYIGQGIMKVVPDVAKVSSNITVKEYPDFRGEFAVYVKDQNDLDRIIKQSQLEIPQKLNLKGTFVDGKSVFTLSGVVGSEIIWPKWMK
jgi:GGDEF domain-containing protein